MSAKEGDPVFGYRVGLWSGADEVVAGPAEVGLGNGVEFGELLAEGFPVPGAGGGEVEVFED